MYFGVIPGNKDGIEPRIDLKVYTFDDLLFSSLPNLDWLHTIWRKIYHPEV